MEPLEPDDDLLESLYVVNKAAKRLADEATSAYERGDVTRSNVNSARKDALYRTKTAVLNRIVAFDPDRVVGEYHSVNGDTWLLVTVDGWAFHNRHARSGATSPTGSRSETGSTSRVTWRTSVTPRRSGRTDRWRTPFGGLPNAASTRTTIWPDRPSPGSGIGSSTSGGRVCGSPLPAPRVRSFPDHSTTSMPPSIPFIRWGVQ